MLPGGIVPLADYVRTFYQKDFADVDTQINFFLAQNAGFYVTLISPFPDGGVAVVFEGPADEVDKLRKEQE